MVTAGSDIYLFGGHGKKLLNDLYKLNPDTGEFTAVQAAGEGARRGFWEREKQHAWCMPGSCTTLWQAASAAWRHVVGDNNSKQLILPQLCSS